MIRTSLDEFKYQMAIYPTVPEILLCGAKPWEASVNPDHRLHCERGVWVTTDVEPGEGVELVCDLQTMWQSTDRRFDGVVCPAVLEHIPRPWLAVHSMAHVLKPGGIVYIQTHQTFPLHYYPSDYFRFSREALEVKARDSGLEVLVTDYGTPCTITPSVPRVWNHVAESFLDVSICARKPL